MSVHKKAVVVANAVLGIVVSVLAVKCIFNLLDAQHRTSLTYFYLVVFGFFLFSLRLGQAVKIKTAMVVVSCWLGMYLVNLYSLMLRPTRVAVARRAGVALDSRTEYEVVQDLRRKGVDTYPVITGPSLIGEPIEGPWPIQIGGRQILPLGGISNKTTVFGNESGQRAVYYSDEHGFHNPSGIWSLPKLDVAVVGDSFVHGCCVPSGKDFVSVVRATYPKTLSLGMEGSGPLLELAAIEEYLTAVRPKIILWAYFDNDLSDLEQEKANRLSSRYLQPGFTQGLLVMQPEIDASLAQMTARLERQAPRWPPRLESMGVTRQRTPLWVQDLVEGTNNTTRFAQFIRSATLSDLRNQIRMLVFGADGPGDLVLFRTILKRASATTASWNGRLYFVYFPSWLDLQGHRATLRRRNAVLETVREVGLPIIDVYSYMLLQPDQASLFYSPDSHYSEEGYRIAAEAALNFLSRRSSP